MRRRLASPATGTHILPMVTLRRGVSFLSGVLLAAIVACAGSSARADVIHLKNGATIQADGWEVRGDDLLVRQGTGRVVIPRAEVVSIDATAPQARPTTALAPHPGSAPSRPGATAAIIPPIPPPASQAIAREPSRDRLLQAVEDLKQRIGDYPVARAENTRQLVDLLNHIGTLAYKGRDYDQAAGRFREALTYDGKSASAQFGLAATYVAQGQDLYARSVLDQALLDHPEDADLHALQGDVYYSEERPEEALAAWQRAFMIRPTEAVRTRIDKLRRERAIDSDYVRSEAAHFTLKYDGERAGTDLSGQILDYLEQQFRDLEGRFDYYPSQPIIVILYPQRQFYEATLAESNVGGLFDGKIRVPIGGLQQIDAEARSVLVHELTHAFIAGKSRGAAPRWLHEGLAQYMEGRRTPGPTAAVLARQYRTMSNPEAWGQTFSYPSALSFVEFLIAREGLPRLVDVLDAIGRGATLDDAFEKGLRETTGDLRRAWGDALAAENLQ